MSENMRIWNALSKTDPKHTKPFKRAGGFQGTAIKPIWLTKRLTEQFGPAGHGWGMDEPKFQTVNAGNEILVFCTVGLWYFDKTSDLAVAGKVYGVGGDKVLGTNKYGPFTNDEAFKASYTDALSNAMKQIGMGADIHMGLFEDDKYLREVKQEFADGPGGAASNSIEVARKEIEQITGNGKSTYQLEKERKAITKLVETARGAMGMCTDRPMLRAWWNENKGELRDKLPEDDFAAFMAEVEAKRDDMPALEAAA